ncbi:MAG: hypothetical protein AAFR18_11960 [Cyanobacteria bacterium J06627_32]
MHEFTSKIIAGFFLRLISAELYAWLPKLANQLLLFYVRFLPEELGLRLLEEWQSLLSDTPGNLAKLIVAIDLSRAIFTLRREGTALERLSQVDAYVQNLETIYAKSSSGKPMNVSYDVQDATCWHLIKCLGGPEKVRHMTEEEILEKINYFHSSIDSLILFSMAWTQGNRNGQFTEYTAYTCKQIATEVCEWRGDSVN